MPWSLLTVNNNVSLISINVAPSSFLAAFIILLVFGALWVSVRIPFPALPRAVSLPALPSYRRLVTDRPAPRRALDDCDDKHKQRDDRLKKHALVLRADTAPPVAYPPAGHGRPARPPRRLLAGFRVPPKSHEHAPLVGPPQRAPNGGPRRLGHRFRRWLLAAGVAEPRQRRPESRLLAGGLYDRTDKV
ncbi:hypothetical protein OCS_03582 [Ophiocordyceps sinensis CO18]|uniref:Uncharacterized protein n=1 Tax=Ophiocordyceps sinensis (strain Co18 / CGMCC 3.14243) TaxID=911162 RepID=T5A5H2_OPHSC|nr:hypothetical protein OCS_03582 [Ophiocordyceps sinensis CO18]